MFSKNVYVLFTAVMLIFITQPVQAKLILKIDDPATSGTEVIVEDEGALDLADGIVGTVEYCTDVGAFNATCLSAFSKPVEGSASLPRLLLNIDFLSWSGELNISATDTDFAVGPTTGIAKVIGTALGVESVTIDMWSDSDNQEFGEGDLIYRYTDNGGNMIREEAVESGPAGSLTLEVKLESKGAEMNVGFQTLLTLQASAGTVEVPNVVGDEQSAAEQEIIDAGLTVGTVTTEASDMVQAGHVISQSPEAGADVGPGTKVNLVVSAGSDATEVPNPDALSGNWYDPAFDGEGYIIINTSGGMFLYYFGHDSAGNRLWLVSELTVNPIVYGKSIELIMYSTTGTFADPSPEATQWGTLVIIFDSCTAGRAQMTGQDGTKKADIVKLAGIGELSCDN